MAPRSRRIGLLAIIATSALVLSACAGDPTPAQTTTNSGETNPDTTLTIGLTLEPTNLDLRRTSGAALEQILIDNIYEGLVTRDQQNNVIPRLASEYEVSTDGLTYTFTLHDEVTFHDGEPLTVSDVVSSLDQVRTDPSLQGNSDFSGVQSVSSEDDSTVVITLDQPNQNFLFLLTGPAGVVVKEGDTTDTRTAENGTGPYTLSNWSVGSSITFERFDDYWGTPATLAEVVFEYIPDPSASVNAALDGSLDVLTPVDPLLVSPLEGLFDLTQGETTDKATLAFNNAKAPLDDVRVREALRLAVDHDALTEALGGGKTLYGPIPELDPGYEDLSSLVPFDPERSRQLLSEAGQSNLTISLTIPSFYGTTVSQLLVSNFNDVGVTLSVNPVEFATWLEDVFTNKDYDLSYVWHVEPRDFDNWANPDYYYNYNNSEVQDLYAQALTETDPEASADLLRQAARIVSEDHAADWLFNTQPITATLPHVSGFPVNSTNARLPLDGVTVSN